MSKLQFYTIDVETTGFSLDWHEITQISIIRNSDRHQMSKFIKPEFPQRVSKQALEATGRTYKDLLKGLPKKEAVEELNKFIENDGQTSEHRCMIGHNVSFDRRFCFALWASLGKIFPASLWLDTKSCTKAYANKYLGIAKPKLTLQASLELCGKKMPGTAHDAIVDTRGTYILHDHLVKQGFDYLPFIKRTPHGDE